MKLNQAKMHYKALQRSNYVNCCFTLCMSFTSMLIPVGFWLQGVKVDDPNFLSQPLWPHILRFGFLHAVGAFGMFVAVILPLPLTTWPLRKLRRRAKSIVTEEHTHDVFIAACLDENLDCSMSGFVASTPENAWLATFFMIGTALSWFLVV